MIARMRWVLGVLVGLGLAVWAAPASADVTWLCHPGQGSNPCVGDLTVTNERTGGVGHPSVPAAPKIDCFYVYPTTSNEPGPNASKLAGPELQAIAKYQARQFSRVCRVFSPVYRQITVLARALNLGLAEAAPVAYADVREAFQEYLATENRGRGFVLIGHSQGATMLRKLIREEVDTKPRVRRRLVSAILPGANVLVRKGADIGGDFNHVPACRSKGQAGCVAAWSTFDYAPPGDALFGRPRATATTDALGLPGAGDYDVLCTNPATLANARRNVLTTLVPSEIVFPGVIGVLLVQTYGGLAPFASTPWVRTDARYEAHCSSEGDAHTLRITPKAGAPRLRPAPDDTWGQHLVDVNLPLGDLIAAVRAQIKGYRIVRLSVRRTGARSRVTIRTAPRSRVRVIQRLDDRRTGRKDVGVRTGLAFTTFRTKRLRHYTYTAKRLN